MANLFDGDTPELEQFNELCLKLTGEALSLTSSEELEEPVFGRLRKVRSSCSVLLAALQQIAANHQGSLMAPPPMV